MDLEITGRGIEVSEPLKYRVEERLANTLAWNNKTIRKVRVIIDELTPEGVRPFFRCIIQVDLRSRKTIRIRQEARRVWDAVDFAAAAAEDAVEDALRRSRRRQLSLGRIWG